MGGLNARLGRIDVLGGFYSVQAHLIILILIIADEIILAFVKFLGTVIFQVFAKQVVSGRIPAAVQIGIELGYHKYGRIILRIDGDRVCCDTGRGEGGIRDERALFARRSRSEGNRNFDWIVSRLLIL